MGGQELENQFTGKISCATPRKWMGYPLLCLFHSFQWNLHSRWSLQTWAFAFLMNTYLRACQHMLYFLFQHNYVGIESIWNKSTLRHKMVCAKIIVLAQGNCVGTSIKTPFGHFIRIRKCVQTRPHNSTVTHKDRVPQIAFQYFFYDPKERGSNVEGLPT